MTTKPSIFTVTLQRDGISLPWGFRLSGGCDSDYPLVVTKVLVGSPSDGVFQKGDIIRKIGNYDARDIRHTDALSLFKNAGSSIAIVVEREVPNDRIENHQSRNALPFIPQPPIPGAVATPFTRAGLPHYEVINQQHPRNNFCRFPPALLEPPGSDRLMNASPHQLEVELEKEIVTEQPYRTSPLVLPGAKVSKDPAPTMSYLRHHPNPMMRSGPVHYEWLPIDVAKKQQLADTMLEKTIGNDVKGNKKIVSKPYNTPIGLYSEQNIAHTVNSQAGFTPNGGAVVYNPPNSRLRKTVVYDPSKSETFKALQEAELGNHVQEISAPPTPRVFSPTKAPPHRQLAPPSSYTYNPNRASPQPHHTAPHSKSEYGVSSEEIHQSHSFKRLMNMVNTDY